MRPLNSWGRLNRSPHHTVTLDSQANVSPLIGQHRPGIAYGMGRSYGDVCLNPGGTAWLTASLNNFLSFNESTGLLRCESGVLLRDIQRIFIPRGWTLPVSPGTQLVTVGGAIANDVHGKNHHRYGSFGDHVTHVKLARTDGDIITCSPDDNPQWLAATIGGLGLTGVILEAEIQLTPATGPWLDTETEAYECLDDFFNLADDAETAWEHTVSWIDCLSGARGRGIFMRANPARTQTPPPPKARPLTVPFTPPLSLVNTASLHAFNSAYFHLKKFRAGKAHTHYTSFFYPLDNLLEWNRMYGPRGFYQYQCVIPRQEGKAAVSELLAQISKAGEGSFLAVLKTFGMREAPGMLSFPRPGVTLALDFPNRGSRTEQLFTRLDAIVTEAGGRLYPAKDARMPKAMFEAGYPRLAEFIQFRDSGISSGLSRRLMGH